MQPYSSVEQSIIEGELEVKELFEYAQNKAAQFEAYVRTWCHYGMRDIL
jgi:hypothetical protein